MGASGTTGAQFATTGRRASNQGSVVRGVPVFGQVWEQLPDGFAGHTMGRVNARLRDKGAVGFNTGNVQRVACRSLHFLHHTELVVQGFKQRTAVGFGGEKAAGRLVAGASRINKKMPGRRVSGSAQSGKQASVPGKALG